MASIFKVTIFKEVHVNSLFFYLLIGKTLQLANLQDQEQSGVKQVLVQIKLFMIKLPRFE